MSVMEGSAAETLAPIVRSLFGRTPPLRVRFWDGSTLGPATSAGVVIRSPDALRRLLWSPGELGLGRAYVSGDLDLEGDIFEVLGVRDALADDEGRFEISLAPRAWLRLLRVARRFGVLGGPLGLPAEEARPRGRLHSRGRDATAVSHHYDVGNDFYALFLGSTMTYSCAYFERPDVTLDVAQTAKYDLICRKLGLGPGARLLDIGCGWGGMVLHAASHYGVTAVGVTISNAQAELARKRVAEAGLADQVEIRLQDYRDVRDGPYDAAASIGMFEHVGLTRVGEYFENVYSLLAPEGRMLNHAISRPSGEGPIPRRSFLARYVFPDGQLHEVGRVVSAMQDRGFEVRDVESLREHYACTLRAWVTSLESSWEEAERLVGTARARVWRLYMAASALEFEAGRVSVHQVLAIRDGRRGSSGMPATRDHW